MRRGRPQPFVAARNSYPRSLNSFVLPFGLSGHDSPRLFPTRSARASFRQLASGDNLRAQSSRKEIENGDGDEHHDDDETGPVPIIDEDALGKLHSDPASADNAEDRRRAHVRFEKV